MRSEYDRKLCVAADLADEAWLRGGLDAMHDELAYLLRMDADSVVIAEFTRLYHKQILRTPGNVSVRPGTT